MNNILFSLLHISVLLVLIISIYLVRIKHKKQIHYVFMLTLIFMLIWSLGYLFDGYVRQSTGKTLMIFVYFWFVGLFCTPIFLMLTGIIYARTKITFTRKYYLLFVVPVLSFIVLLTNDYHHLFFVRFSVDNTAIVYGKYFIFHSVYSYACILIGLGYLIYYSVKNSGFFSKQSLLIVCGSLIPLVSNFAIITRLIKVPLYTTAISFSIAIVFYSFAIFRFNFLSVAPIALQTIVDRISDSFLVINEDYQITDYNKTIVNTFKGVLTIERNKSLRNLISAEPIFHKLDILIEMIGKASSDGTSVTYDEHIQQGNFDKYFTIEVTPIISNQNFLGTIILFKDITENIKHLADIEEKHAIMMEQERLASLGQLIGGISHNLKTPIMSIAGAAEALKDLVKEYEQSVGEASVTLEDHFEIAGEMQAWIDKIRPYCTYMTDIINAVKGQATNFNMSTILSFTINELVKRIDLLMRYELIKYNCTLNTHINVNYHTELYGDVNNLVQIFDNIIINAIQAYEGKNGTIDFYIEDKGDSILFIIKDYAKGIPESIKERLLKEMVTTKGKDGTGLGLFMSYSTIKGRFGGKMWFESEEGKGTAFFIQLPHNTNSIK